MAKTLSCRLKAYEPNGAFAGYLPQPLSWEASYEHDDAGTLKISYSRAALGGTILKRGLEQGLEISLEASDGTTWSEPYNSRFLLIGRSRDATDRTDTITLTLVTWIWLLKKIRNLNTTALLTDGDNQGKRAFLSANTGTIMSTLMSENTGRGGAAQCMPLGFDTGKDSAGNAWSNVMTLYYDLGIDLYTILDNLASNGICDWRTDGRTLKLWNADSPSLCRDLSTQITIQTPTQILQAPEEESIEALASHILVQGDSLVFAKDNPAAPTPWGKWELYLEQGGVSDQATAELMMSSQLDQAARVRGQYTRAVLATGIDKLPLIDYHPGDWITAPTVAHGEKVRVQRITLSQSDAGLQCALILNDRLYDSQTRQAKRVAGITGGAVAGGAQGGRPAPDKDHRVAQAPLGLVVATSAYIDSAGIARGLASLQWAQATQATDNTAIDVSGYQVEYRKHVAGALWMSAGTTDASRPSMGVGYLECGVSYEFHVRAMPTYSDNPGLWCDPVVALVASDTTPPSVPSTPILASQLGVVDGRWDGKTYNGGLMESDLDHVEIGMSSTNGSYQYRDSLQRDGHIVMTGLTAGATYWFALRSADHSGNRSAWGAGASITVASAVTPADIKAINDDLTANDAAMTQANKDIAANKTTLTQLDSKLTTARTDLDANTAALTAAKTDISQAKADIVTANGKIAANTSAISAANTKLTQAQSDIQTNATALAAANTDLTKAKADIITANGKIGDNAAAISAANTKLTKAQSDIQANATAIAGANATLTGTNQTLATVKAQSQQTTNDLATANGKLATAQSDITKAKNDIATNTSAIATANTNISNASSKAQSAIDKANSVGTSLDGMHSIFHGPDDPTTLPNMTVHQGDSWQKTQKYWTRWEGDPNNSASLLADFYTYWEGDPNNSTSILVPLDSRIIEMLVWDGTQWNDVNLVASNVVATGTITGDLVAANTIRGNSIIAGSVTADRLVALSITSAYIAANAVVAGKIDANAITAREIKALSVTSDLLAASSVIAGKIATNAVTADSIAANSVNASKIVSGSITSALIAANTITAGNLASNSVNTDELVSGSVTSDVLATNSVIAAKISAGAVTVDKLAVNSVNASKIVAGSITSALIAANTITAGNLASNSVNTDELVAGSVTVDILAVNSVNASKIVAGSITGDRIAANTITALQIASQTIKSDNIAAGAITGSKIDAVSIFAQMISANAMTIGTSSNNTALNSGGMDIVKNGMKYAHLGSDAPNGLQLRNPNTGDMMDLANMAFGAYFFHDSTHVYQTPSCTTSGGEVFTGWMDWPSLTDQGTISDNNQWKAGNKIAVQSPTGNFIVFARCADGYDAVGAGWSHVQISVNLTLAAHGPNDPMPSIAWSFGDRVPTYMASSTQFGSQCQPQFAIASLKPNTPYYVSFATSGVVTSWDGNTHTMQPHVDLIDIVIIPL
ncbi:MAG: hypothetical protein LKI34_02805 [Bifidobacterium tibiigranuli]|jgi:predicted  nucleic acid-binding Zn-ribbon protein|uniref:hypothetical protein n=1 Tax=Bifidobacterium tibiigranuli TaxID=2172043 RepID=UPI0026EAE0D2|nr:hypothetical protein [Bifidobacterium tibiigranuli]MCI1673136.1 hypothetical protein [Bifidobacterium tibiigranuli]MCI1713619.1 hypothetical protein [Bifidobacterium tibiigranuli]